MSLDGGYSSHLGLPNDFGRALEHLRSRWTWFAAFGATSVAFGLVSLLLASLATLASVYLIAIFVILVGGIDVSLALDAHRWSGRLLAASVGLFYIVAGSFFLANPLIGAVGLTLLLGVSLLITGVMRIAFASQLPEGPKWHVGLAGVLTTLVGMFVISNWPGDSKYVLGAFLGVDMIVYGASWFAFAMFLRGRAAPRT